MKVSVELLYHFQCDRCQQWWSVGDFAWQAGKRVHCPHCGEPGKLPGNPLLASDFTSKSA